MFCVGFGYGYAGYGSVACGLLFNIVIWLLFVCVRWAACVLCLLVCWYRLLRLLGFTLITGFALIGGCMLDFGWRFSLLVGYFC